jgi:predicted NBD/HSP70 family sugar kinase
VHFIDADNSSIAEFIQLFNNASMVITTSFHGTAFALNFGVPLVSIVPDNGGDDRQITLLKNCGANGCLETFCSATAIIKYAQKLIEEGNKSIILDMADNNIENINAKIVFDAFRENDFVATETINRFKDYLAKAMGSMINTLDPDIISIGGGVSRASDIILNDIKDLVRKYIVYKNEEFADIVCATLGADAGIIGAAFLQ